MFYSSNPSDLIFKENLISDREKTGSEVWRARTEKILKATSVFFSPDVPNVMYEVACEPNKLCNEDQKGYKGYLARWMAATTKVASWTSDYSLPRLAASAKAAAAQCSGGNDGTVCGQEWTKGAQWDGIDRLGSQMSALEVIQSNLITMVSGPLTNGTGGTSFGDPAAGTHSVGADPPAFDQITTAEKAGAGVLTAAAFILVVGGSYWMAI